MQIEGLIPFKSSTNQDIASLYFLRISFYALSSQLILSLVLIF